MSDLRSTIDRILYEEFGNTTAVVRAGRRLHTALTDKSPPPTEAMRELAAGRRRACYIDSSMSCLQCSGEEGKICSWCGGVRVFRNKENQCPTCRQHLGTYK